MRTLRIMVLACLVLALAGGVVLPTYLQPVQAQGGERISAFGRYAGYSERVYNGYDRFSQYVPMRDGTRLAVDYYRPTLNGALHDEPLPVIWTHTRYQRANQMINGRIVGTLYQGEYLLPYGYIIGVVDVRGGGASFGVRPIEFSPAEAQDAYDITEWFAAQPWSDGNIGMFGRSYLGITQLFAAAQVPPHLRAIMPEMHVFDLYEMVYQNGIYMNTFMEQWDRTVRALDASTLSLVAPVDGPEGMDLLQAALALREQNGYPLDFAPDAPYRDSTIPIEGIESYAVVSPAAYLDAINESGVAIYQVGGWFDMYATDPLLWYANLTVPHRLAMPAWSHGDWDDWLLPEALRWFDYWLKGIDNGIMEEPSLAYELYDTGAFRFADQWPLPEETRVPYYFAAGPSGSVASANDGGLRTDAPTGDGADVYTVRDDTTVGAANRFTAGYGGPFGYGDLTWNDEKGLTYTTPPLEADLTVIGHPVAHLWVSSTATDGDFFVYLEEVDADGESTYLTEGKLRASYRALAEPALDYLGLPWHPGREADLLPLVPGELTELVFALRPTANLFEAGHRVRITVTGADWFMFDTPELDPRPVVTVYRNAEHASYVELPVVPAD